MTGQQKAVGCTELLDTDEVHQDGRGQAVVSGDTEPVGGGQGEDEGVGGDQWDDGGDEATDAHADRVEGDTRHPLLVTQPPHTHLANGVQNSCTNK